MSTRSWATITANCRTIRHVNKASIIPHSPALAARAILNQNGDRHRRQCDGGTYSEGSPEPVPKKNSSICSTRKVCACGVQGCSRYSLSSIFCRSTHSPQACLETFLKIFWPNSESKGGSSRPSISFLFRVQKTMCAIDSCSHNPLYWRVPAARTRFWEPRGDRSAPKSTGEVVTGRPGA